MTVVVADTVCRFLSEGGGSAVRGRLVFACLGCTGRAGTLGGIAAARAQGRAAGGQTAAGAAWGGGTQKEKQKFGVSSEKAIAQTQLGLKVGNKKRILCVSPEMTLPSFLQPRKSQSCWNKSKK